jgi:hypothetical protein
LHSDYGDKNRLPSLKGACKYRQKSCSAIRKYCIFIWTIHSVLIKMSLPTRFTNAIYCFWNSVTWSLTGTFLLKQPVDELLTENHWELLSHGLNFCQHLNSPRQFVNASRGRTLFGVFWGIVSNICYVCSMLSDYSSSTLSDIQYDDV